MRTREPYTPWLSLADRERIKKDRLNKVSRRKFLGLAGGVATIGGLEATGVTRILRFVGNLFKREEFERPTKLSTEIPPKPPTIAPSPAATKFIELDTAPTKTTLPTRVESRERDLREELKAECKKAFNDFKTQFPDVLVKGPEGKGPLINVEKTSDFYGLVYQRAGQATGSDTGVYEEMTVAKSVLDADLQEIAFVSAIIFMEIERNKERGIKDMAKGVSEEVNMLFFELALESKLTNYTAATNLAFFVDENWMEIIQGFNRPELLVKSGDAQYLKGMVYAYMLSNIKGILTNPEIGGKGKYHDTLMNIAKEKEFGEVRELGRLTGFRLEQGGNIPIVPKEKFIPKAKSNQIATKVAEKASPTLIPTVKPTLAPVNKVTPAKETTFRPISTATAAAKPTATIERLVQNEADFSGTGLLSKYTELMRSFKIIEHNKSHLSHHWDTLRARLNLSPSSVLTEKQKRIDPRAIVVHYTAGGTDQACINYLSGETRPVPTVHFVIGKDGRAHQIFRNDEKTTFEFHATGINPIAFGVEIVALSKDDITESQVAALAALIKQLKKDYPGIELITSHQNSHIAAQRLKTKYNLGPEVHDDPTGKGDPGGKTMKAIKFILDSDGVSGLKVLEEDLR